MSQVEISREPNMKWKLELRRLMRGAFRGVVGKEAGPGSLNIMLPLTRSCPQLSVGAESQLPGAILPAGLIILYF